MIAEENHLRQELQMAVDSKDSDIERLRCQLTSLSVHSLDSTSISSGNDTELADGYPGQLLVFRLFHVTTLLHAFLIFLFIFLLIASCFPSLYFTSFTSWSCVVRITHSSTSESMSFTYQRTHKSVCVDTRPNLRSAHALFDSDSEDEEPDECEERGTGPLALTYKQSSEPESGGDSAWSVKLEIKVEFKTEKQSGFWHLCIRIFFP